VCGLDERDELRVRVGVVLDQNALVTQAEDGDLVPEVVSERASCYADARAAVGPDCGSFTPIEGVHRPCSPRVV
jgi:hypothetical protein